MNVDRVTKVNVRFVKSVTKYESVTISIVKPFQGT